MKKQHIVFIFVNAISLAIGMILYDWAKREIFKYQNKIVRGNFGQ